MSLFHFDHPHNHRHIQPHRFVEYTGVGAAAGAAAHGLGAVVLHPFDPDHFQRTGALVAGLVGGAAIHAVYGGLAACAKTRRTRQELKALAGSTVLSASLGGIVGAGFLTAMGSSDHPGPLHLTASGLVGGSLLGAAAGMLKFTHALCCCCWPRWLQVDEPSEHGSIFGPDSDDHGLLHHSPRDSAESLA